MLAANPKTAQMLRDLVRRRAVGRYLDALLSNDGACLTMVEAIADLQREAQASGLTDKIVDAEFEAWQEERRSQE